MLYVDYNEVVKLKLVLLLMIKTNSIGNSMNKASLTEAFLFVDS